MKKIEAIIRKEKSTEICNILEQSGVGGITVLEARGFGHHRNGLQEKVKLEIYVDEFQLDKTIELICQHGRTGVTGDGKIAVVDLQNLYRIRTGESGANAI